MKKIVSTFMAACLGAGIMYGALMHHFILFDESIKIMKKTDATLHNTLVDARGAKAFKLVTQPDLVAAGLSDLISEQKGISIPLP